MAFPRRLTLLLAALAVLLALVWARMFSLQVASRGRWLASAKEMRHPGVRVDAPRGRLLDADGRVLVQDEAALGLCFVAADWERRVRLRCAECGAVTTRLEKDRPSRRACSCKADASRLQTLPDEDLAPLEDAIGVPRGTLARYAQERTRLLEERVKKLARQTVDRLDLDEFRAEDVERALREDHFRREIPLRERGFGPGWRPEIADLPEAALRLLELDREARYRGFSARASLARRSTHAALLAQCLGRATAPDAEDIARLHRQISRSTTVGRSGLEGYYDDWLRGVPGIRYLGDDADEEAPVGSAPEPGADVQLSLSIDACIEAQRVLDEVATGEGYAARGPPSGGFVVMDPRTGAILATSECPRLDERDDVAAPMTAEEARTLRERAPGAPPLDVASFDLKATPSTEYSRVAQIAVEPGSALKIVSALYTQGTESPPGSFYCSGPAHGANDKPGCHAVHGAVGPEDAICVSCNRWFAWALARPANKVAFPAFARLLGLGSRTGADFASEGRGLFKPETEFSLRHIAIGQGQICATPLQMVRIAALVANGGTLVTPRFARSIGGREIAIERVDGPATPRAIAEVRRGMAAVVASPGGTARGAFRDHPPPPGVAVYAKTGTAQVPDGGQFDPDRVEDGPWHHWFVGFAERGTEQIAFAMVLYARREAAAGHTVAAAVARYLQWWFGRGPAR